MYTQCEHCKAIFRVNMKEVTIAKGKLRCGECKEVFIATNNLSTTLPEPFQENITVKELTTNNSSRKKTGGGNSNPTRSRTVKPVEPPKFTVKSVETGSSQKQLSGFSIFSILLSLLLLGQVLYNHRYLFLDIPRHSPEKVKMLTHNIFVHPNEPGVLLISASMINHATYDQAYPMLEVKLTDAQSTIIALRRFSPKEYLEKYDDKMLLPTDVATTLKLKIKDPGNKAKRFQFGFL